MVWATPGDHYYAHTTTRHYLRHTFIRFATTTTATGTATLIRGRDYCFPMPADPACNPRCPQPACAVSLVQLILHGAIEPI